MSIKIEMIVSEYPDMQKYFKVSAPSVHQMVVTLERKGLIKKIPGKGRSISLLVPRDQPPDLK